MFVTMRISPAQVESSVLIVSVSTRPIFVLRLVRPMLMEDETVSASSVRVGIL